MEDICQNFALVLLLPVLLVKVVIMWYLLLYSVLGGNTVLTSDQLLSVFSIMEHRKGSIRTFL